MEFYYLSYNFQEGFYQNSELIYNEIIKSEVNSSLKRNTFYNYQFGININNFGLITYQWSK